MEADASLEYVGENGDDEGCEERVCWSVSTFVLLNLLSVDILASGVFMKSNVG